MNLLSLVDKPFRGGIVALSVGVVLSTLACTSVETQISGPSEANPLDSEEGSLVYDVGKYRSDLGLPAVKVCASLNVSASAHADDMRDHGYLSDTGQDGSTARSRGCAAGYQAGCSSTTPLAELVASGKPGGHDTFPLWKDDAKTNAILQNPALVVIGVGRSLGAEAPVWAVDLAGVDEPSCNE